MQGNKMMGKGMGMHRRGQMTGEWYQQMMSMHQQMADMHERMGQQSMARTNRRLSRGYGRMMQKLPATNQTSDEASKEEEQPSRINGEQLFVQNCASCHGNKAEGYSNVFPPLVNTEWVSGDKSVPIRILLNGMQGEIEVNGQSYQGVMPSFKARLSTAEMAAILNYLRSLSESSSPQITMDDVASVKQNYKDRNQPWTAAELKAD